MRIGASILLITLGAIIAFAIRVQPRDINLDAIGWILMLVGVAGLILNHFVWERRKQVGQFGDSPDVFVDPDGRPTVYQHPQSSHDPRVTDSHRIAKDHRLSE
jgi:hypothetical protein